MRSTNPGRLSSSQDFSIGRSISLTRSSSVRALLLSTVWASVLKALSTADTVERDSICGCGAALSNGGGSNAPCRGGALAASVNSRSSSGSTFWNDGCGGGGVTTAISSVSSNTSASGKGAGRISSADVASSRPFSKASMSSWLLDAAGAGAGAAGGGGGGGLAAGGGGGRAGRGGGRRRGWRGLCGGGRWRRSGCRRRGNGLLRFRRRRGRGGGLFGGRFCFVVGNDTPDRRQNLLHRGFLDLRRLRHLRLHIINALVCAFYTKHDRICRFRICRPGFSSHEPDLSPDQVPLDMPRGIPPLL